MSESSMQHYRDQVLQVAVRQARSTMCICGHLMSQHGLTGCCADIRVNGRVHTCICGFGFMEPLIAD